MRWLLVSLLLLPASLAQAIDRAEVMDRAQAFCYHPWTCSSANLQASCMTGYDSYYTVGDHLGVCYDWGGYASLHQFGVDIRAGQGAGSPFNAPDPSCTTGVDCSGYVSRCWDTSQKYGTWTIMDVATTINRADLQPGDALNDPGNHIELYAGTLAGGAPYFYHASPPNVHMNWYSGWAGVQGFDAIRYDYITSGGSDLGTMSNPIVIDHWPYTDNRDTTQSQSDILDACGADWTKNESGREYVYVFTTTVPGTLTATVSDGAGVDIDLHLYRDLAEHDCIARHDSTLDIPLDACGTYYLVLDTFVGGVEYPGPYTLNADFTPTGGACSAKPEYDFLGGPGKACAFPNHEDLSYCNPNLGVTTCIYTTGANPISFCSRSCRFDSDCADDFVDGCCQDIDGEGSFYCMIESFCPTQQDGGTDAGVDAGGGDDGGAGGDDAGVGGDDAGVGGDDAGTGADTSADTDTDADTDTRPDTGVDAGTDAGDYSRPDIDWPPDDPGEDCGCAGGRPGSLWMFGAFLIFFLRRRFVS
jgi:hypothetical protein